LVSSETVNKDNENEMENKVFIKKHYEYIADKQYNTAYANYLKPKTDDPKVFQSWYEGVYDIKLSSIENI
jgi:hypothetical protein